METILSELPLVIFTSCVLLGAGAYAAQGVAVLAEGRTREAVEVDGTPAPSGKDTAMLVCLLVVIVGFVAAFFHLANPVHAVFALAGIGHSPMSNEIAAGVVFTLASIAYCALSMAGKLKPTVRKACTIVLAVLGFLFAIFTGAAYMMNTIATWDTPLSILESAGIALLAGSSFLAALKTLEGDVDSATRTRWAILVTALVGGLVGLGSLCLHVFHAGSLHSGMATGAALTQASFVPLAIALIAGVGVLLLCWRLLFHEKTKGMAACVIVFAVVSVFAARLVFYALQLSVGL